MLSHQMRRASGRVVPITLTYNGFAENADFLSATGTVTSVPLGTANSARYIVVAIINENNGTADVTGVTIAGETATNLTPSVQGATYAGQGTGKVMFWGAAVPTGTSGSVVVTWGASDTRRGIGVWSWGLIGAKTSAVYHEATAQVTTSGSSTGKSTTCNVRRGGVILAAFGVGQSSTAISFDAGATEQADEDQSLGVDDASGSVAQYLATANEAGRTITVSHTSRSTWSALQAISFDPAVTPY